MFKDESLAGSGSIYQLEKKFKELTGHSYAVAVCNATQALFAVFLALELRRVEFVTTPYTWPGSLAGALLLGNIPVFGDIDPLTLTLDPVSVKKCLSAYTKAILAVDIYGNPCKADVLKQIANDAAVWLIMDCAQSFGAMYKGKQSGALADVAIFSFSYGKPLYAGEGAMITTPHWEIYEKLIFWTQHPYRQKRDIPYLDSNEFFLNMRIHPLAAEIALARFDEALEDVQAFQKNMYNLERSLSKQLHFQCLFSSDVRPSGFRYVNGSISQKHKAQIKTILDELNLNFEILPVPIEKLITEYDLFTARYQYCYRGTNLLKNTRNFIQDLICISGCTNTKK